VPERHVLIGRRAQPIREQDLDDRVQLEQVPAVARYDEIQGRWLPIDSIPYRD
jgi:hypothetical protein